MQKNQKNTRAKKSGHVESDGEKSEYANQKMPLQKSKKWAKIDCKGKKQNTADRYVRDFDPNVLR